MRLLICDDLKINFFSLPSISEDYFIVNYYYSDDSICETLTLKAIDGYWTIATDSNIVISDYNNNVGMAKLTEYSCYNLYFADLDKDIMLHVFPDLENYKDISVNNMMMVGFGNMCNIIYHSDLISERQLTIGLDNNQFVVTNLNFENPFVYINNRRFQKWWLNIGDVIFVNGLKIIWMGNYFKINNPNNLVDIVGLYAFTVNKIKATEYQPVTETERNSKLFTESQIFFHTPRLYSKISKEKITLDAPPEAEHSENLPLLLTFGSSAIMGITSCMTGIYAMQGLMSGTISGFNAFIQFTTCILMLTSCIAFPMFTDRWQKNQSKKREKRRQERYGQYLNIKEASINKIIKKQETILHDNNLTLDEIEKRISNNSENIWEREIIDDDFLSVRLGVGNLSAELEIEAPKEQFLLFEDDLRNRVLDIAAKDRKVENVPIVISMIENRITPFIIQADFRQQYIDSIMLQILYYYSPIDLKIAVFTDSLNEYSWDYIKYLPYCWDKDRSKRFFATNENEMQQVSMYLEQIYDQRLNKYNKSSSDDQSESNSEGESYKNYSEYYLIVADNFKEVKNLPIINRILKNNNNIGFSLLIFENSLKNLPSRLDKFINVENKFSGIFSKKIDENSQTAFQPEFDKFLQISKFANIIGNIPVSMKGVGYTMPTSLNFLEMYRAGRIDHLNVLSRWHDNDPTVSLNAPIGVKENGKIIGLDLHEKVHGPHGLIAGSTGSGKSEFIITYVLSMAINYDPKEVQFVLIDYKGGGLAGAFENREKGIKIPHLIGTITNLDTSEMNRTLVSIQSELKRRQIKFNEARDKVGESTIDIYKYQKLYREGKVSEPISHLFIICDEFAELKQQQPEFMDELISTSRIGRSLGVHLILATQKPSGVVNDQIWSNSRFKVCLKVQTTEDSTEMLKKPDAAYIKEAGRFYLQVGNNEIFELGQSGWAGARYIPVARIVNKIDDSIDFVGNDGTIIKSINDEVKLLEEENLGEQLTNIVRYLYDIAKRENIDFSSLWLPSIPADIYLGNIINKYGYKPDKFKINPVIGEYDKPAKQVQGLFSLNLNCQNTVVFGIPNSGKENLVSNLIYSSCVFHTPDEVNFYILDFGAESLGIFSKLPHVGDFITASEKAKVESEFNFLEKEIRKRKELFADYSGKYEEYCANSGHSVPLIVTILNAFESFMENCSEYYDYYVHLLREGSKYGIVFVTTAISTSSIRSNVLEYFKSKVLLQLNDSFDYQFILGAAHGMVPKKIFGRGLSVVDEEPCEFQTANITLKDNLNEHVRELGKKLSNYYKNSVPSIKVMPNIIKLDSMFKYAKQLDKIPLGYSRDDVELVYYNFTKNKSNLILGKEVTDKIDFMCSIIDLIDSIPNIKLNIFDFISCVDTDGNASYYNLKFLDPFNKILENKSDKYTINIIIGIGNLEAILDLNEFTTFSNIMKNMDKLTNQTFIIFDNIKRFEKLQKYEWYDNLNKTSGIWVGNDIDEQNIFKYDNFSKFDLEENMKNLAYVIEKDNYTVIKSIGGTEEDVF